MKKEKSVDEVEEKPDEKLDEKPNEKPEVIEQDPVDVKLLFQQQNARLNEIEEKQNSFAAFRDELIDTIQKAKRSSLAKKFMSFLIDD